MIVQFVLCVAYATNDPAEKPPRTIPADTRPTATETVAAEERTDSSEVSATDIGTWLIHLARHEGHRIGRTDPRSASLRVLALLEAAAVVAPANADAYYWTFDILSRLDRRDAARAALSNYVRLRPDDTVAQIRLLELELAEHRTPRAQADYIKGQLDRGGWSRPYESELRTRLSRYFVERRENEAASREIEKALRLNPANIPARAIAYELFGETEPALQRVELALQLIAANPAQGNIMWELAELLDQLSLHRQAQEWYRRALDLHERSAEGPVAPAFWCRLAISYTQSGEYEKARAAADAALAQDPDLHTARLMRSNASAHLGDGVVATEDLDCVDAAYQAQIPEVMKNRTPEAAAEIAWFYCFHRPSAVRALDLATIAYDDPNPGSLARLAMGCALRMNHRSDEAIAVLEPLAAVDQLAAVELARALLDVDQKSRALTILHKAATLQYSGIGYDLICDILARYDEIPPDPPAHTRIAEALNRFDRRIFDFHRRPGDFLKFRIRFAAPTLSPAGPIEVVLRLENTGPFPITLGDGFMARPLVSLTTRIGEGREVFQDYLQFLMNTRPVLAPGDVVEKTASIDVGPVREAMTRCATTAEIVEVSALFDPVCVDGSLSAGVGTIRAPLIGAERPGIDASGAGVANLLARSRSPNTAERIGACDCIGALLADSSVSGPPADSGTADAARLDSLKTALGVLMSDREWGVRAHALVAAAGTSLDRRMTATAAPCVRDDHAVVRMLSVQLFAEQQGERFKTVLEVLGRSDPDRIVRIMAKGCSSEISQTVASPLDD